MLFLAEQHLVAAKLLRKNGERGTGVVRELFIRKSNSCIVCVRLMAKDRGSVSLGPVREQVNRVGSDFVGGGIPSGVARLYRFGVIDESAIRQRFEALARVLDERGRRRFAAAEATSAGHGGIIAVMRATGIARSTIGRGLAELRAGETPDLERVRRVGGGRRPLSETDANLLDDLRALVEPETRAGSSRTASAFAQASRGASRCCSAVAV